MIEKILKTLYGHPSAVKECSNSSECDWVDLNLSFVYVNFWKDYSIVTLIIRLFALFLPVINLITAVAFFDDWHGKIFFLTYWSVLLSIV